MDKNIISYKPKTAVDEDIPSKESPIIIKDDGNHLTIKADKKFLLENDSFTINNLLMVTLSPFFLNKDKFISNNEIKPSNIKLKNNFPHIAFFIENKSHYTGGRYSLFHQAVLLSQFVNVTVVTNQKPVFYKDFKEYYNERFNLIISRNYLSSANENNFDIVVGVPLMSGEYATYYSDKWKIPLYLVIFESPNWIRLFRDGDDANEEYWSSYKKCLSKCNRILVPSYESKKYLLEWINGNKNVDIIYPCLNEVVAKKAIVRYKKDKRKKIIISTRMTPAKSGLPIIKGIGKNHIYFIVGKIWSDDKNRIEKLNNEGYDIRVYEKVGDKVKFDLINSSDILIHPSTFEGFGMPPMEAIWFNKPVVAFDLPVLREIYGNSIVYAKFNNIKDFIAKVKETLSNSAEFKPKTMSQEDFNRVFVNSTLRECFNALLDSFNIPKISAGVIVNNGEDYLKYSIESIYHLLNEIIIVVGSVKGYAKSNNKETEKVIKELIKKDYLRKIKVVRSKSGQWSDKIEMQNEIAKRVTGEFYVKLDHDEIWKPETLLSAINTLRENPDIDILKMPFIHFWLNFNTVAKDAGGKWSTKHPRIWRWKKSYRHDKSFNYFEDKDGTKIAKPFKREMTFDGDCIYHFGYVRKLKVLQNKIKYYKNRGIESYVVDTVTKWKKGKPTQPTQDVNSWAEDFEGKLPKILNNHPYKNIKDIRND